MISRERAAAMGYLLTALLLWLVLELRLLPALFAGLLTYVLINALAQILQRLLPGVRAHGFVVAVLAVIVVSGLTVAIAVVIQSVGRENGGVAAIFERLTPLIERARSQLPATISASLPDSAEELRSVCIEWLRIHASQLQLAGKQAVRTIGQLFIGIMLGAMLALYTSRERAVGGPLSMALNERSAGFVIAFRDVVFAQTKISAINTLLTGIFLLVVLPLFGVHLPLIKTLVAATFILGLLPVIGNLLSNVLIAVVAMSISFWVAVAALAYLICIHKLEYFLNARIVGRQIRARAWEMLIAMLLMETVFGMEGLIAAPIYYGYLKRELAGAGLI